MSGLQAEGGGDEGRPGGGEFGGCPARGKAEVSVTWTSGERGVEGDVPGTYSLAKTPLKAAQAPLAMASSSHWVLSLIAVMAASCSCRLSRAS